LDEPVDVVINLVAIDPREAAALVPLVRPDGLIVSVATPVEPPPSTGLTAKQFVARNDVTHLAALVDLIDAGHVTVDATETFPLDQLGLVHRRSETGQTNGKIIIIP
jgi:NADPH:quinone reductase-like Zn-dependent oxidoreductase